MKVYKLNESFYSKADKVELEYPNLDIVVTGERDSDGEWDEYEITTPWTYEVDKQDLYHFIYEECISDEECPLILDPIFDPNKEETWNLFVTWLDKHFETIYSKYEAKILDKWIDSAVEDAEKNFEFDEPDWDCMPGGHDDYDPDDFFN